MWTGFFDQEENSSAELVAFLAERVDKVKTITAEQLDLIAQLIGGCATLRASTPGLSPYPRLPMPRCAPPTLDCRLLSLACRYSGLASSPAAHPVLEPPRVWTG